MLDVVIAGAGPAGSVAAALLARAGARVLLVDRARFPRDKLCGDTLNPGALAALGRLGLAERIAAAGAPIEGMVLTGPGGVRVEGRYPGTVGGRALMRRDLDRLLLDEALRAGAGLEEGVAARAAIREGRGARHGLDVKGVIADTLRRKRVHLRARVTIAADGRRSALAFGLGLAWHPPRPRRWAIGAYFEGVGGLSAFGEMHVRAGHYLGVAALPGRLANACLVLPLGPRRPLDRSPGAVLLRAIDQDPSLRERFASARMVERPVVLGPLAVDARAAGVPGLLLAGDAAGFIDPMTGDGLGFAVRGGELAARAALDALERGPAGAHVELARWRRQAFAPKWRFNRMVRALVASPAAVRLAAAGATLAPGVLERLIAVAGDVSVV